MGQSVRNRPDLAYPPSSLDRSRSRTYSMDLRTCHRQLTPMPQLTLTFEPRRRDALSLAIVVRNGHPSIVA
jgi:hypothetical protein